MAKQKQPERWESVIVAAAMAVAGTLFMFDKLGSLVHSGMLSSSLHAGPVLVVVLGLGLWLADWETLTMASAPMQGGRRNGDHE
jgi:hypothetical protein